MINTKALASKDKILTKLVFSQKIFFGCYLVALVTTMSGMEIFSSLFAIIALLCLFFNKPQDLKLPPFFYPIIVFAFIVVLGAILDSATFAQKVQDVRQVRFLFLYFLLFFGIKYYVYDVPWLNILLIACFLVGIYGFIQHFIPLDIVRPEGKKIILYAVEEQKLGPLVLGTFNHHLTFSNIFIFYACLFFSIGISHFRKYWVHLVLGSLLFLVCIWTQSRVGWIAVPITLIIIALGKSKRAVLVCLGIIVLGAASLYSFDSALRERLELTLFQKHELYNIGPRIRLWKVQWEMFKDYPLLGIGYNNNERRSKEYMDRLFPERKTNFYGHAHSTPLQILSSTGILGTISYIVLWGMIFLHVFRLVSRCARSDINRWIALGVFAGFVGFHIQGLTQWNFGDAEVLHNVVFFWALTASLDYPASAGCKK